MERKHCPSKNVLLYFKKVLEGKKVSKKHTETLLRTHVPLRWLSEASPRFLLTPSALLQFLELLSS